MADRERTGGLSGMSSGNSRVVRSAQTGPHPDLEKLLQRHFSQPFQKPFSPASEEAYAQFRGIWASQFSDRPLVLDAGCGVGWSTIYLARRHAEALVIGIDQSLDRLTRGKSALGEMPDNLLLIRADLVDFWRLLARDGIRLQHHYLLYPNPWPKIGHLSRRWQGHAVFPAVVALGGQLECRSNWPIYVEEMAYALNWATNRTVSLVDWHPETPITPFEHKYLASGHQLSRCTVDLP